MDFTPSLKAKKFFRFTGPPENWLTAIKYMTWGMEEKYMDRWKEIQTGDVFFIHSTGPQTSFFKNAKSGIIGMGIIGSNFSIKENYLWMNEVKESRNIWPLLVPFSEIYLFNDIPSADSWNNPNFDNLEKTKALVELLLRNYIPLSELQGFPQMGSFSSVSKSVADQILFYKGPLYEHQTNQVETITSSRPTRLEKIEKATEALRYADSLEVFTEIKARIIKRSSGTYMKDNELLARADEAHTTVLQQLLDIFKTKGYETRSNKYVDLFAYNGSRAFLIEVKSTENRNFRTQARKGVVQLHEYDYFEINRFINESKMNFKDKYKVLVPSLKPTDEKYIEFMNYLSIGVGTVRDNSLNPVGKDFGFSKI